MGYVYQSENLSLSENVITYFFCNLHFCLKTCTRNGQKLGKFGMYLGTQKKSDTQNFSKCVYIMQKDFIYKISL